MSIQDPQWKEIIFISSNIFNQTLMPTFFPMSIIPHLPIKFPLTLPLLIYPYLTLPLLIYPYLTLPQFPTSPPVIPSCPTSTPCTIPLTVPMQRGSITLFIIMINASSSS